MAIIAQRYVEALYESAKDSKQSNMYQKGLEEIANLYSSNEEFKNLLLNPCVSNEEKINTIKDLFKEYCEDNTFVNLLQELLNKGRIGQIQSVSEEYTKLNNSVNKAIEIKIVVASKLNESEINEIVDKYKKLYNASEVKYTVELDEGIIGGIKVIVGNTVYDSTIATQLKQVF